MSQVRFLVMAYPRPYAGIGYILKAEECIKNTGGRERRWRWRSGKRRIWAWPSEAGHIEARGHSPTDRTPGQVDQSTGRLHGSHPCAPVSMEKG